MQVCQIPSKVKTPKNIFSIISLGKIFIAQRRVTTKPIVQGERGGSVVECRTPEQEVRGSRPTAAVLCPWARHFTPRKYWLITQEAVAPSRHDWKIVDWDVKPQHKQTIVQNGPKSNLSETLSPSLLPANLTKIPSKMKELSSGQHFPQYV